MKVVDAGVVVELLVGALDPGVLGDDELACPHLIDSEVIHALRGLVARGALTANEGSHAVAGFLAVTLTRFSAHSLRARMWELRDNYSAYDATYVALAEAIGATALLTTDPRLVRAPGSRCRIELL